MTGPEKKRSTKFAEIVVSVGGCSGDRHNTDQEKAFTNIKNGKTLAQPKCRGDLD